MSVVINFVNGLLAWFIFVQQPIWRELGRLGTTPQHRRIQRRGKTSWE